MHQAGITYDEVKEQVAIVHFAGAKPWLTENIHFDIEQIWWDYAKLAPPHIYHQLLEEFQKSTIHNQWLEDRVRQLTEENQKMISLSQELIKKFSPTP